MKIYTTVLFSIITFLLYAQPSNDECLSAISINVQEINPNCITSINGTTLNATPSAFPPSCGINTQVDDDVWYSFTAISSTVLIRIGNATLIPSGNALVSMAIYENACPVSVLPFQCFNASISGTGIQIINGLQSGNTYYLRVWNTSTTADMNFTICIQTVSTTPENDQCSTASLIALNPFATTCNTPVGVSTIGATMSLPNPSCTSTDHNDDVWFKFAATSASINVEISDAQNYFNESTATISMAIYANTCSNTIYCEQLAIINNTYRIVSGLTIGDTIYLRFWLDAPDNYGSFNLCLQEVPAPPNNDHCVGAILCNLDTFGQLCSTPISISSIGATESELDVLCTPFENNDDIWYKFTAPSTSVVLNIKDTDDPLNTSIPAVSAAVYHSSECPSTPEALYCNQLAILNNGYRIVEGLTINDTYYLRLWADGVNNYFTATMCLQQVPPPPINDECLNAIQLTPQTYGQNCNASTYTTIGATTSLPELSCTPSENNDDVWFSFTATSATKIIRSYNITDGLNGNSNVISIALYNMPCPLTEGELDCQQIGILNNGIYLLNDLTIGNAYLLRLWSDSDNNYINFDLCLQEVLPPPINDNCAAAIVVTVQPSTVNCTSPTMANTTGATMSMHNPSCTTVAHNDDVWYKFTAVNSIHKLIISNAQLTSTSGNATIGYALYSACPPGNQLSCATFVLNQVNLTGLTAGQEYYLRFWSANGSNFASFEFCIQETPQNNDCENASMLPITNGFCTSPIMGTLQNATIQNGFTIPSCNPLALGNDVWYKIVVPQTTNAIIQTSATHNQVNNLIVEAYSGNCQNPVLIQCDDNGNPELPPSSNHARITISGNEIGDTILLRIMPNSSGNLGQFAICAWDTTANILPQIADSMNCQQQTIVVNNSHLNQYLWVPIFSNDGKIIAEVYSNGVDLDTVKVSIYTHESDTVRQLQQKHYLDRNITIHTTGPGNQSAFVRWYYTKEELMALQMVDPTVSGNTNLELKYNNEFCSYTIAADNITLLSVDGHYANNYYKSFYHEQFSKSYFLEGKCGAEITWLGVNEDWFDWANWDCGGIPYKYNSVIIPNSKPFYPIINQTANIKNLSIENEATVTVTNGAEMIIHGND